MTRHRTIAEQAVAQLLGAYRKGFFPMADVHTGDIHWHNPETRGVIPLTPPSPALVAGEFHVPRTVRQRVRQGKFIITADRAFTAVIVGCADPNRSGAWIDETIIRTYRLLHEAGHAHSIEAWLPDEEGPREEDGSPSVRLVGGLYGVSIGSAFFGESMFSKPEWGGTDASKVCLVHLVAHLRRRGYTLLDTQMWSWHLEQFGCEEVPREAFLPVLAKACRKRSVTWGEFQAMPTDAEEEAEIDSKQLPEPPARKRLPGTR